MQTPVNRKIYLFAAHGLMALIFLAIFYYAYTHRKEKTLATITARLEALEVLLPYLSVKDDYSLRLALQFLYDPEIAGFTCRNRRSGTILFSHEDQALAASKPYQTVLVGVGRHDILVVYAIDGWHVTKRVMEENLGFILLFILSTLAFEGLLWTYFKREKKHLKEIEASKVETIALTTQMLAHDLKKPLSMLKIVLASLDDSKKSRSVGESIAKTEAFIAELLTFNSEVTLVPQEVTVLSLAQDALAMRLGMQVELDIPAELVVAVDRKHFVRVLTNLLDNAHEAGGRVWLRGVSRQAEVEIAVGNSGSFIAAHKRQLIFQPFYTEGKKHGTGLGLAIVQRIVEAHGGGIICSSHSRTGTEFKVCLPKVWGLPQLGGTICEGSP